MAEDFSGQNLQGRSFKGQDLTGANFSGADIRGVTFKGARLAGAIFTNVKAGLRRRFQIVMSFISILVGTSAGLLSAFLSLLIFVIIDGITRGNSDPSFISGKIIFGIIVFCAIFLICMIVAIRKKLFYQVFILFFIALALAGVLAGAGAGAGAVTLILLSIHIAWRTYKEDDQFAWLRKWGVSFASLGGTSFYGADLRGAKFTGANLKGCRFDASSNITRTCFSQAKNLNLARATGTILENPAVRDLLVTGNGEGNSYAGCNLKGACLKGANLANSDLTEADLSGGTLEDASLINANLSKVQALDVEFRGADLTGACLHSWNIDSSTRLEGAHAAYVFLLDNYKERRPSSGEFREGEFSKLFQEVIHTVDFIFKMGSTGRPLSSPLIN